MELWQSILLGIIQGLTEFLPVSSSGHLLMGDWLLGTPLSDEDLKLAYDVALHGGTLLALFAYFRHEVVQLAAGLVRGVVRLGRQPQEPDREARLAWLIVLGTIPAVLLAVLGDSLIDAMREPQIAAMVLVGFSALFLVADRVGGDRTLWSLTAGAVVVVGLAQALALFPGVSRSGATIATAMIIGLARTDAARFSFLLSMPAVLGATLMEVPALAHASGSDADFLVMLVAGVLAAFASGYLAIAGLLRFLGGHALSWFVLYRVPVGIAFLLLYYTGTHF